MKATKKIVGAACALVAAVALSAGSTFAWFATNSTVTATGMAVTAQSDNAYLIISHGTTLTGNAITADAQLNQELLPTKPVETLTSTNVGSVTTWGVATSTSVDDANTTANPVALKSGSTYENYVAKTSFMVGLAKNSDAVDNALRLDTVTISNTNLESGITVVVVCGTNLYSHNANVTTGNTEELATATAVSAEGGVQVDVYIYIDGSHENVKTANADRLGGSVVLTFSVSALGA